LFISVTTKRVPTLEPHQHTGFYCLFFTW